jgi:hypothetical protein
MPSQAFEAAARRLSCKVIVTRDGRLVITITVAEPFDFGPPATLVLVLADGSRREAKVDTTLSTAAASALPGQVLRLVAEPDGPLAAPVMSVELGPNLVVDVDNG